MDVVGCGAHCGAMLCDPWVLVEFEGGAVECVVIIFVCDVNFIWIDADYGACEEGEMVEKGTITFAKGRGICLP